MSALLKNFSQQTARPYNTGQSVSEQKLLFCTWRTGHRRIKAWIEGIKIPGLQLFLCCTQCLAKPLEMHDLASPQKPDRICDLRILHQPQDIIIGQPCLLFCCNHIRTTF